MLHRLKTRQDKLSERQGKTRHQDQYQDQDTTRQDKSETRQDNTRHDTTMKYNTIRQKYQDQDYGIKSWNWGFISLVLSFSSLCNWWVIFTWNAWSITAFNRQKRGGRGRDCRTAHGVWLQTRWPCRTREDQQQDRQTDAKKTWMAKQGRFFWQSCLRSLAGRSSRSLLVYSRDEDFLC